MLRTAPIRAYIPASDVARARKFYEQTVGLRPKEEYAGGVIYECGGVDVFMYPTGNAGTSKASQAYWQVDDIEAEMADLKRRGVVFEKYNLPGTDANGITTGGGAKAVGNAVNETVVYAFMALFVINVVVTAIGIRMTTG